MENNKLLRRINYVSVLLFVILILMAIFDYHREMHFFFKGILFCSCMALMFWTFFFVFRKYEYGIQDYFFSLLFQSFVFILCVFAAKQGGYKSKK